MIFKKTPKHILPQMLRMLLTVNDEVSVNSKNSSDFFDFQFGRETNATARRNIIKNWLKEFRSVQVNTGRRSGHTACILHMMVEEDLVVMYRKDQRDEFISRAVNPRATVKTACNCEHELRAMNENQSQPTYRRVYVDSASCYKDKQLDGLFNYLKHVSTKNTQVILLG